MMSISTEFDIHARYDLLCRASQSNLEHRHQRLDLLNDLDQLNQLIQNDLPALARQGSPDHFADILRSLTLELEHFHEFCEFPDLAQKVVIGVGGAFSAGKSSLINTILGKKRLVVEVDPTTSLPTYLLHGSQEQITALNLFQRRVELSADEFATLTHEEQQKFGSQVSGLLKSAFISDPEFAWHNLALLDTPGYSKPEHEDASDRTDEHVARAQLNSAHFIVWVVSAAGGVISEDDIQFLASLNPAIPKLVVLSRADSKPASDIEQIVLLIKQTLADRAIAVLDVLPTSARKKRDYPVDALLAYFEQWNGAPRPLSFAQNFKRQFTAYARFIESEQRQAHLRLNRLNRILTLADLSEIQRDAEELQYAAQAELARWQKVTDDLNALQKRFFAQLKKVGDQVGIALPEPDELELLELKTVDLLGMLRKLREQSGKPEPDVPAALRALMTAEPATRVPQLLRRTSAQYLDVLQQLAV
jgi:GTP-binding protein EngB required for normal cell division